MKKRVALFFLGLILLSGLVLAIPSLPHTFVGEAKYKNTAIVLTGQNISASIGGYDLGIIGKVGAGNQYEVSVDPQGRTGLITFYIGGSKVTETATYVWGGYTESFKLTIQELPLSSACGNGIRESGEQCDGTQMGVGTCENVLGIIGATGTLSCTSYCTFDYSNCSAPKCGDGICNNGETCSSCSQDCGACPPSGGGSSGGGGGGGGGGSSSSRSSSNGDSLKPLNTSSGSNSIATNTENLSVVSTEKLNEKETNSGLEIGSVIEFVTSGLGITTILLCLVLLTTGVIAFRKKKNHP
jgi:uncharacterized membrane protein YgcG